MFFFQWDEDDWKQQAAIMVYVMLGLAGIIYMIVTAAGAKAFLGGTADVGGAIFVFALTAEGATWNMVMALGKLREARVRGRQEERERMIQAMREDGLSEDRIRRIMDRRESGSNGKRQS